MFCPKCGTQNDAGAGFCANCGETLNNNTTNAAPAKSGSSFGWGVLGFFIPLVGLILFLSWKNDRPADAKAAGIGALIGFILGIVSSIIMSVLGAAAISSGVGSGLYY